MAGTPKLILSLTAPLEASNGEPPLELDSVVTDWWSLAPPLSAAVTPFGSGTVVAVEDGNDVACGTPLMVVGIVTLLGMATLRAFKKSVGDSIRVCQKRETRKKSKGCR